MRHDATGPSRISETLLVSAARLSANLAALALLGCVLAYWTWTWLAPRPEGRVLAAAEAARVESAYALFGGAQPAASAPTGVALTLLGVAAASGGRPGHAVLRVDGRRTVVVRAGEEIAPGMKLSEVHADHVVLDHRGARETLAWPVPGTKRQ